MKKKLIALVCLVLMFCTLLPISAAADNAIEKVLCTTSTIPVAQANSQEIYAATSTSGCYVDSYLWRRTTDGYIVYGLFGTENVEVEISLRALDGWYFSESCAVYLNNSSASYYIGEGGKTLTLTRTYAPELWLPSIIKHPGSETVDEGGLASFVASATLTAEYEWYIINPDTGESYRDYDIPNVFEGAAIGSNREGQLNIHNVPASMDGWHVYCVFSGPGGDVRSAEAKIKVNYETPPPTPVLTAPPTPQPTPEPTPKPTPRPISEEQHAHFFSSAWSSDSLLHWKECDCGERIDEGSHIFSWTEVREATRREPGLSTGTCEICGYSQDKEVPYNGANSILRYVLMGFGGLVALTIIILLVDSIAAKRRRRRRHRRRR